MTLRVWVDDCPVGRIDRFGRSGMTFAYDPGVPPSRAISLNMPPRVASYDQPRGLLPIFDMNLPEGHLKEVIRKYLAKTHHADPGQVSDYDVLSLVGGNLIGRIRVLPEGVAPERRACIPDIGSLLSCKATASLVSEVMTRYGLRSGVSGAMPKSLLSEDDDRHRKTVQTRDFILKFDAPDYPGLSLNEFWCLEAARAAGCRVVAARMGDAGDMLAVSRFDVAPDGRRLGFEDATSLNGLRAEDKYGASSEKALFRTFQSYLGVGPAARAGMAEIFRQFVTSVALRNGDAHLKNFGVLYEDVSGPIQVAPAYDLVTTTVYLRNDLMSLTLNGSTRWPKPETLELLGSRAGLSRQESREIMAQVAAGIRATIPGMILSMSGHGHGDLADRMASEWTSGLQMSLGVSPTDKVPSGAETSPEGIRP